MAFDSGKRLFGGNDSVSQSDVADKLESPGRKGCDLI
jgi:hypothetical protein